MKKLILAGLLLAMIAAGVVYWQMTARIETQLERAAGQLSPIGRLTLGHGQRRPARPRADPRPSIPAAR